MTISLHIPPASTQTVTDAVRLCREVQSELGIEDIFFNVDGLVYLYDRTMGRALLLHKITEEDYIKHFRVLDMT